MLLTEEPSLLGAEESGLPANSEEVTRDAIAAVAGSPATSQEAEQMTEQFIDVSFDKAGTLGIEFEQLEPPYVIEAVHSTGHAHGTALAKGDKLQSVDGEFVGDKEWESLVTFLSRRPVTLTFVRRPNVKSAGDGAAPALLSGFAGGWGSLRQLGGNVAKQSISGVGGVAQQGISIGSRFGSVTSSLTGSLVSGLADKMQDTTANANANLPSAEEVTVADSAGGGEGDSAAVAHYQIHDSDSDTEDAALRSPMGAGADGSLDRRMAAVSSSPALSDGDWEIPSAAEASAAAAEAAASTADSQAPEAIRGVDPLEAHPGNEAAVTKHPELASRTAADVGAFEKESEKEQTAQRLEMQHAAEVSRLNALLQDKDAALQQKSEELESSRLSLQTCSAELQARKGQLDSSEERQSTRLHDLEIELQRVRQEHMADVSSLKKTLSDREAALRCAEEELAPLRLPAQGDGAELQACKSKIAELEASISHSSSSSTQHCEDSEHAASRIAQLEAELATVRANDGAELQACKSKIAELEGAVSHSVASSAQHGEASDKAASQIAELEAELVTVRANSEHLASTLTQLTAARADSEQVASTLKAQCEVLEAEMRGAASQVEEEHRTQMNALRTELELQIARAQSNLQDSQREHSSREAQHLARASSLEDSIKTTKAQHDKETAAAEGKGEQARFALAERERLLEEKDKALLRKDQEAKSLLRQLEALGDASQRVEEVPEVEAPTTFEVMFALEGRLGVEFQRLEPPYIVQQVHPGAVASDLGLLPGDELVAVAEQDITSYKWDGLVEQLSKRPVVARFQRQPGGTAVKPVDDGLLSSVSSVGTSLLSKARSAVPMNAPKGAEPQNEKLERLQAELERMTTLMKARDEEFVELASRLSQREEAIRQLECADEGAADISTLVQERVALVQQVDHLKSRVEVLNGAAEELRTERDRVTSLVAEEVRQKEEHRQQEGAMRERYTSLLSQFESLRSTCQTLSGDAQQKHGFEAQVQELLRMNAQWQEAHSNLHNESESLKQRVSECNQIQEQIRAENEQLRAHRAARLHLEERLREMESALEASYAQHAQQLEGRSGESASIQRLQGIIESLQESGESQAGQLEGELLERSRECQTLRREVDEQRRHTEELQKSQQSWQEASEATRALREENEVSKRELAAAIQERDSLNNVVERCIEKLERESRERPFLCDKRMVTQMLAAYLEQRGNLRQQEEILARMADLLGFTTAEREQVGLVQRRTTLLEQQEDPGGLAGFADSFAHFLIEESEAG